jgi:hypothetical protein
MAVVGLFHQIGTSLKTEWAITSYILGRFLGLISSILLIKSTREVFSFFC